MSRWFRFYSDALRNPKVAALSDRDFRLWVSLLSAASENEGRLPPANDLKHLLSVRLDHLLVGLDRLIRAGLIDALEQGYEPHNWSKFQYKSDVSTERVRRHRSERNVSETPPDTETEQIQKKEPLAQQPIAASAAAPNRFDRLLEKLLEANGMGTGFRDERNPGLVSLASILGLIQAGFDLEADILAGIRSKPNAAARTWDYFVPQIREFVERRDKAAAVPKPVAAEADWPARMEAWKGGTWGAWGPKPGDPGCQVPSHLLESHAA